MQSTGLHFSNSELGAGSTDWTKFLQIHKKKKKKKPEHVPQLSDVHPLLEAGSNYFYFFPFNDTLAAA